jgi:spermidine dehydrogenase
MAWTDKELGMHARITRRDFLQGAAMTVAASAAPSSPLYGQAAVGPQTRLGYDPPALHGLRGSHPGAFEVAHRLRDGTFWATAGQPQSTGETYDLVVVGGGISGLASARFFHQAAGKAARVLILENHDDFGGHAKRNEFQVDKTFLLAYGGTYSIESPAPYSATAQGVIRDLGIDVASYPRHDNEKLFADRGLKDKIFFDQETFGTDALVDKPPFGRADDGPAPTPEDWKAFAAQTPLSAKAKADIVRLYTLEDDLLPGLSSDEKKARLARMSYADYLTNLVKVDPQVVAMLQSYPKPYWGLGTDAVSAQDEWGQGLPGFHGLKLSPEPGPGMGRDAIYSQAAKDYFFHFPDGNATVARLLARGLVPAAIPGNNASDVVTAPVHYDRLDQPGNPTRIRLNSTVVRVRHEGDPATAKEVEISYMQNGQLFTVKAAHCILACWHPVIPYIATELPPSQLTALKHAEKVPLVYAQVALTNWQSFARLKIESVHAPAAYYCENRLDYRVSIGNYHCTRTPDQPVIVTMEHYPTQPGLSGRQQHRAGRAALYTTPFETYERNLREQLVRTVGAGGFDPQRDIAAITVNRWPHGYAYQYNSLWDKFWLEGTTPPCVEARQPWGRVAIANSDAAAYAYTDSAIDQAYRAVKDLKL